MKTSEESLKKTVRDSCSFHDAVSINESEEAHSPATEADFPDSACQVKNIHSPEDEMAALQSSLNQTKEQLLRALAEVENTNKRAARDREEASKYAVTQFAREILTVGDNLQRALSSLPPEQIEQNDMIKNFIAGVEMTAQSLHQVLSRFHVISLNPEGQSFEPQWHQAMMEVEHSSSPGTVVNVFQVGYKIHDRLLRPAMVSVSKGQSEPTGDNQKA